jgi:hypothetical protein
MAAYTVKSFASYDDFEAYVTTIETTTDIQVVYSQEKGYIVIVG